MCFLAAAAASTCARCLLCGVAMITACTWLSAIASSNEVPMASRCSAAKSPTVSGSSVTPRTKRIGAPKSRAAFTRFLPHQPRPTIAVLSMTIRLRRRRAGLLERMGARESVVLGAGRGDARDGRIRRQIDLEEIRPRHLTGQANVGNGELLTLAIGAGLLLGCEMLLQPAQRRLVPMLRPFQNARLVDLEFSAEIFAHARHDQRMRIAGDDLSL